MTINPPSDTRIISAIRGGSTAKRDSAASTVAAAANHRFTTVSNFRPSQSAVAGVPGRALPQGPDSQRGAGGPQQSGGAQAPAKADGATGPEKTVSGNGPLDQIALAQALNSMNKLKPEHLANQLQDGLGKTLARQQPGLKEQGQATNDPRVNEELDITGKNLSQLQDQFDELAGKIEELVTEGEAGEGPITPDVIQEAQENLGFEDIFKGKDFIEAANTLSDAIKEGGNEMFSEKTLEAYDKVQRFNDVIGEVVENPSEYGLDAENADDQATLEELKGFNQSTTELLNKYDKGAMMAQNDLVAGMFATMADDARDRLTSIGENASKLGDAKLEQDIDKFFNDGNKVFSEVDGINLERNGDQVTKTRDPEGGKIHNNEYGTPDLEDIIDDQAYNALVDQAKGTDGKPGLIERLQEITAEDSTATAEQKETAQQMIKDIRGAIYAADTMDQVNPFNKEEAPKFQQKFQDYSQFYEKGENGKYTGEVKDKIQTADGETIEGKAQVRDHIIDNLKEDIKDIKGVDDEGYEIIDPAEANQDSPDAKANNLDDSLAFDDSESVEDNEEIDEEVDNDPIDQLAELDEEEEVEEEVA